MAEEPWYVAAFGSEYRAVYPHRDLESARAEVEHLLASGLGGGRVLDLCCGFGRHTLALAEQGVDVVGMDLSAELLPQALELPGGACLAGRLVRGDARALPFADEAFDGVVNLFSSFGYFGDEGDGRMLDELARVLRPGGRALMDLMNPERVRAGLVPESTRESGEGTLVERRRLEDGGRRVVKDVRSFPRQGAPRAWREEVRMYERAEMEELLAAKGMAVLRAEGDFLGGPYGPRAERLVLHLLRT